MTTAHQKTTARMRSEELYRLQNATAPVGYQAITERTRLDEVARAAAASSAALVEPPPAPPVELRSPGRRTKRPFSQVAALLPAVERPRAHRPTQPPRLRAPTAPPVRSLAVPDPQTQRMVADVRERIDRGEDLAGSSWISARVVSHLTAEEIAMLPMDLRLRLPAVTDWQAPARIELTPMPGLPCIDLGPAPSAVPIDRPIDVTARVRTPHPSPVRVVTFALALATLLLGTCAAYALL